MLEIDSYDDEYQQFQWDVHMLIENTRRASDLHLGAKVETDLADIKAVLEKSHDPVAQEHLVDEHVDVLETYSRQAQFLRNMALVALSSRLTHALRNMTKSASFAPRKKGGYGHRGMSEYMRLWMEYTERFGIDFTANADRIAFVEPMREVRNQIVHDGAEAQTYKFQEDIDWNNGVLAFMDDSFSKKYPQYVSDGDVAVTEEQLTEAVKAAISLVGWLAKELRAQELDRITKKP
ncbi:MAG: hypothetical protein ACLP56_16165 [Candidatus Sulfotelmatobacter sp.]